MKGDGLARGLHAHGVELHADQFRAHRDGRGQRRAVGPHGHGAHFILLRGSQHLPAVFANAEIEVRGLAEKLAAFRDGLLILIRDLDGEIPAKASAGDLRQLRRDGEGRGQLALAAEGQALAFFCLVAAEAERAESIGTKRCRCILERPLHARVADRRAEEVIRREVRDDLLLRCEALRHGDAGVESVGLEFLHFE